MKKNIEFLENKAIADIAFKAKGKTKEELFSNCALALSEIMADTKKVKNKEKKVIEVKGKNIEDLLYNFLEELIYIKDVEGLIFKEFKANITNINEASGKIVCFGSKISEIGIESLRNDVKAITLHLFKVKKTGKNFFATVVVDI